jgi:hypothetical protein
MTLLQKVRWALAALVTGLLFAAVAPMSASANVMMTAMCAARGDGSAVVSGTVAGTLEGWPTGWVAAWGLPPLPHPMVRQWMVYAYEPFAGEGSFELTTGPEAGIQVDSSIYVGAFPEAVPAVDPNLHKTLGSVEVTCVAQQQANTLLAKLDAAAASAERGNIGAAANQLGALKHQIDAMYRSGRITEQQYDNLIATADQRLAYLAM